MVVLQAPSSGLGKGIENVGSVLGQALKTRGERNQRQNLLNQILGLQTQGSPSVAPGPAAQGAGPGGAPQQQGEGLGALPIERLIQLKGVLGEDKALSGAIDAAIKAKELQQNRELKERAFEQGKFEAERKFHSTVSDKELEKINELRGPVEKREIFADAAKQAVLQGDPNFWSGDNVANLTGIEALRTVSGQKLLTAAKENLISNIGRISARSQNVWIEKQINSAFAKIGKGKLPNLAAVALTKADTLIDKANIEAFDQVSQEDMDKFGFVKRDISRRSHAAAAPVIKDIENATAYQTRKYFEEENPKDLGLRVKVPKGTPLTLENARAFQKIYGNNAEKITKNLGYQLYDISETERYEDNGYRL